MNLVLIANAASDSDFNGPEFVGVPFTPADVIHWMALGDAVRNLQRTLDSGIRCLELHTEIPVWFRWDERYEELLRPVEHHGHAFVGHDAVAPLLTDADLLITNPHSVLRVGPETVCFDLSSPVAALSASVALPEVRDAVEQQPAGTAAGRESP